MVTRWQFWIDVGGTFTDCIARTPDGGQLQHKVLSSGFIKGTTGADSTSAKIVDMRRCHDKADVWRGYRLRLHFSDGSTEQRIVAHFDAAAGALELESPLSRVPKMGTLYELSAEQPAPIIAIRQLLGLQLGEPLPAIDLRLGTTRGTNALITRSGARTGLVTTRGFADVLRIGYQTRPHLFSLDIQKPTDLFAAVVEIDERMDAVGAVLRSPSPSQIRRALASLRCRNVDSVAVTLLHACANPAHEQLVAEMARQLGFEHVSSSHEVSATRKLVARGDTTVADAYLNPVLRDYLSEIRAMLHPGSTLHLMTSSGGLASPEQFRGKDSILSGPAGGVVGVARVAQQAGFAAAIGFDMGGTSTDVCRWAGDFDLEYENEKAGVRIVTPMMAIETVAAGGGSLCKFDGVKLVVGPESAGADPGPACYGRGGPLAVTDINFYLGKILPEAFPFPLDRGAVEHLLTQQCQTIAEETSKQYTLRELAAGYLQIANTNMVEAIRCVTVAQGSDPRDDVLVAFGGAAPQHACAVAEQLGVTKILLHPSAGILSALGIGLAEVTVHREAGVYSAYSTTVADELHDLFTKLADQARHALLQNDPHTDQVELGYALDLRFRGLDSALTISRPHDGDYQTAYEREYQSRFGYLPADRSVEVVTARVTATATRPAGHGKSRAIESTHARADGRTRVCFGEDLRDAPVYDRDRLQAGDYLHGPAIVAESISTSLIDPGWRADVLSGGELLLSYRAQQEAGAALGSRVDRTVPHHRPLASAEPPSKPDPVLLEVFNQRFTAIATQMGTTLQKNARSVNVKQRLDYSCAIFTAEGDLVVNAPHIPVHLGAMGESVQHVLHHISVAPGDVIVTNDPYHGGSHLPDVTVITPVHDDRSGQLLFLTASRAHHAEIGGISPGSMPAFSKNLAEEGVLIRATKAVEAGDSRMQQLETLLGNAPFPSRDPTLNLADIAAQIAANRHGANNLWAFVGEYSWPVVNAYMRFIQQAAERKMRRALHEFPDGTHRFTDYLDDGSPISLELTIAGETARLDFKGTGNVVDGNLNANRAIVLAAVMYSLRCLIDEEIPLNQGVLAPIAVVLPSCLLNPPASQDPGDCPAVAGGNVETSQRIVDVVLGAFGIAAASQGTMNNVLFGDETFGYYETICGGGGATPTARGADAVQTHMTNTRLTDPEVLERRYPVRLQEFSIRQHSGGYGIRRGGNGVVRRLQFLKPLQVSIVSQRRGQYAPYGCQGGGRGATGENWLIRADGTRERLGAAAEVTVAAGDELLIMTPGGGGWGAKQIEQ